jgi:hypothetical protein
MSTTSAPFTEREQKLIIAACQCFESEPKVILCLHNSQSSNADISIYSSTCRRYLPALCVCLFIDPATDISPQFAQQTGLVVGSARNAWNPLRKKLFAGGDDTAVKATASKTPASKSAKKRPPPVVLPSGDNASDDEEVATPSKKPKTPATKAKAKAKGKEKAAKTEDEDEDDEDFVMVKNEVADEEFKEL